MAKLCPSAQPGMEHCRVLGVVQRDGPTPMLQYLDQHLPATAEVLAMAAPLKPTEVFRLAATCAEHKCPHFDGRTASWQRGSCKFCRQSWILCPRASYARMHNEP